MPIPKVIVQTWKTKDLPKDILFYTQEIQRLNPLYEYKLFDDNDCRQFLEDNYPSKVIDAFDKLLFGAYKADLWRYAYLYIHGGVYIDIDFQELHPLDSFLTPEDTFVTVCEKQGQEGIFQAFIAIEKGNKFMKEALDKCVSNILSARRDLHHLEITGPRCLGSVMSEKNIYSPGSYPSFRLLELKDEGVFLNDRRLFNIKYPEYSKYDIDRYGPSKRWHRDFKDFGILSEKERYLEMYNYGGLYISSSIRITKCLNEILSNHSVVFFIEAYEEGKPKISENIFFSIQVHPIWMDILEKGLSVVLEKRYTDVHIVPLSICTQMIYITI